jgi:hypothetical protein
MLSEPRLTYQKVAEKLGVTYQALWLQLRKPRIRQIIADEMERRMVGSLALAFEHIEKVLRMEPKNFKEQIVQLQYSKWVIERSDKINQAIKAPPAAAPGSPLDAAIEKALRGKKIKTMSVTKAEIELKDDEEQGDGDQPKRLTSGD